MVLVELTACRIYRRRNQLNPRSLKEAGQSPRTRRPHNVTSLKEGGGPDAQDQSSFQHKKPQGGRRARRPGPVVHPTKEPQVNHWSGSGLLRWSVSCGLVGGGGRPVTTVKDSSLRTQAVDPKKGWKLQGQNP